MLIKTFLSKTSNIMGENKLLRLIVIVIGGVTIYNTIFLQKFIDNRVTIIEPRGGFSETVEVSKNQMNNAYIKSFVRDVIDTAFNYNPQNVKGQFEDLLTMFAPEPEVYQDAFNTFYQLGELIAKENITSAAYIQNIAIDPSKHLITVRVLSRKYKEDKKLEDKIKAILIDYRIGDGQFKLLKLTEKDGA